MGENHTKFGKGGSGKSFLTGPLGMILAKEAIYILQKLPGMR